MNNLWNKNKKCKNELFNCKQKWKKKFKLNNEVNFFNSLKLESTSDARPIDSCDEYASSIGN